ncbi:MAG: sugar nucleotide-binding protein [Rhodospirillaceae bacterium]|nr:sugar nucleotide-binding protein [Rhodospirillaceae bacterium]MBT5896405.1 sugar nucleotide-binding protein [Rhodospirillaceae bacterium]MBT7667662.1 sugar nucleotide-binding protein [Rhodospirillaceae bacterium]
MARHFRVEGWQVQASTRRTDQVDDDHPFLDLAAPNMDLPAADVVILCAAVARIGDCETDPKTTRRINVDGTLAVAQHMAGQGAHIILLSSDKVFDGAKPLRNRNDSPCPACEYGRQKAAAEAGVMALGERGAVLRLSKVIEPGLDLLAGWQRDLSANTSITPFHDLYLAPVPVDLVANVVSQMAKERANGVYHCTGAVDHSYVDLAQILAASMDADPALIRPVSCLDANIPAAARPRYTTLEMSIEQQRWNITAPKFEPTCSSIIRLGPSS